MNNCRLCLFVNMSEVDGPFDMTNVDLLQSNKMSYVVLVLVRLFVTLLHIGILEKENIQC